MTLTIRAGGLDILTTSVRPEAHIVVTFSGSRWFGFRVAISVKDPQTQTAVSIVRN